MTDDGIDTLTASLTAAVDFYEWSGGAASRVVRLRTLLDRAAGAREPLARLLLGRVHDLLESYGIDTRTPVPGQPAPDEPDARPTSPEPQQPLLSLFQRPVSAIAKTRGDRADMLLQLEEQDRALSRRRRGTGPAVVREAGGVLRAGQIFRRRAQMRAAETVLAEALATRPDSPGPLNPETLAWRTLKAMEDLSPAYLTRMVAYVQSLVWIEEAALLVAEQDKPATRKARRKRADRQQELL